MIKRTGCSFLPLRGHRRKWELNLILWVVMFINWCLRFMCPSNYALLWKGILWKFGLKIQIQDLRGLNRTMKQKFSEFPARYLSHVNSSQFMKWHLCAMSHPSFSFYLSVKTDVKPWALPFSSAWWSVLFRLCYQKTFTLQGKLRSCITAPRKDLFSKLYL